MAAKDLSDSRKGFGFVILALLGFFALPKFVGKSDKPETPSIEVPRSSTRQADTEEVSERDADVRDLRPVRDLLWDGGKAIKTQCELAELITKRQADGVKFHSLIVSLPDPRESFMGYRFDVSFDAIQRAVEMRGLILDRYLFPWLEKPKPDQPFFANLPFFRTPASTRPGVAVFRSSGRDQDVLIVFLVTESPVSGVDKDAMARSLDLIETYFPAKHDKEGRNQFALLSPCASGSQTSLEQALTSWANVESRKNSDRNSRVAYSILSGANELDLDRFHGCFKKACDDRVAVTIHGLRHRSDDVANAMNRYLRSRLNLSRIAVLTESNTGFGQLNEPVSAPGRSSFSWDGADLFHFPSRIEQIREDYQKLGYFRVGGLSSVSSPERLDLATAKTPTPKDLPSSLTPQSSAAMDEMTLVQLLTTIGRRDYDAVGIIASDARDINFLARLLGTYAHDTQLFALQADLMLCSENEGDLRGMLIGSTYPLYTPTQWIKQNDANRRHVSFSNEFDQSLFNATLAHLRQLIPDGPNNAQLLDYGSFIDSAPDALGPPIWISVVGERAIYPIRYYSLGEIGSQDPSYLYLNIPVLGDRSPKLTRIVLHPLFWIVSTVLTFASITMLCRCIVFLNRFRSPKLAPRNANTMPYMNRTKYGSLRILIVSYLRRQSRSIQRKINLTMAHAVPLPAVATATASQSPGGLTSRAKHESVPPPGPGVYIYVLLVLVLITSTGYLATVGCVVPAWRAFSFWTLLLAGAFLVVHSIVLVQAIACGLALFKPYPGEDPGPWYQWTKRFFLILFGVGLTGYVVWKAWREITRESDRILSVLALDRVSILSNGVSAIAPALFLGLAVLSWVNSQVKRRSVNRSRYMRDDPYRHGETSFHQTKLSKIRKLRKQMSDLVTNPSLSLLRANPLLVISLLLTFLIFLGSVARRARGPILTEESLFNYLFYISYLCVVMLVFIHVIYVLALWSRCREYLRLAASLPLAQAFDRIPVQLRTWFLGVEDLLDGAPLIEQQNAALLARTSFSIRETLVKIFPVRQGIQSHSTLAELIDELGKPGGSLGGSRHVYKYMDLLWDIQPVEFTPMTLRSEAVIKGEINELVIDRAIPPELRAKSGAEIHALLDWARQAENLIALQIARWIAPILSQVWLSVRFLVIAPLCLMFAINSFPFIHGGTLSGILIVTLCIVILAVMKILIGTNQDEVISRISDTSPNRLTLDTQFLGSIAIYILPLLGALVSVSFEFGDILRAWLGPLFNYLS